MPELPDIEAYISALKPLISHQRLNGIRLASPFLLRTTDPPLGNLEGRIVREMDEIQTLTKKFNLWGEAYHPG